jgi:glycosyltransferase involved in cell wall biosynthesis
MSKSAEVVLIGHPFSPIGRGEDIRSTYKALDSIGVKSKVLDIYGLQLPENSRLHDSIVRDQTERFGDINIFHINADEVSQTLNHLNNSKLSTGHNIIYPAWELERYPEQWLPELNRFDEIWAPSRFIFSSLKGRISKPLSHMSFACEVSLDRYYERDFFEINNEKYVFLFSFDFRSFLSRKNPFAVLTSFEKLLNKLDPNLVMLVIKTHGGDFSSPIYLDFCKKIQKIGNIKWIDRALSDLEMRNLIRVCDCYVSLHRSEGFGRGMAEAMYLGKPVIATGYSGNLDFMDNQNSLLVNYGMIDLKNGDYPGWEGQKWANPDIEHSTNLMFKVSNDVPYGMNIGKNAAISVKQKVGYKSVGVTYADHFRIISRS